MLGTQGRNQGGVGWRDGGGGGQKNIGRGKKEAEAKQYWPLESTSFSTRVYQKAFYIYKSIQIIPQPKKKGRGKKKSHKIGRDQKILTLKINYFLY